MENLESKPSPGIVWNKITWYSQITTVVLGVVIFSVGIWLGIQFTTENNVEQGSSTQSTTQNENTSSPIPEDCRELKGEDYSNCLRNHAVSTLDLAMCKAVPNSEYDDNYTRIYCISAVAQGLGDASACREILGDRGLFLGNFYVGLNCYGEVGIKLQDKNICNTIPDVFGSVEGTRVLISERGECLSGIARSTGDISLCEEIPAEAVSEFYKVKDGCYESVAFKRQDPKICEKLSYWPEATGQSMFCDSYTRSLAN